MCGLNRFHQSNNKNSRSLKQSRLTCSPWLRIPSSSVPSLVDSASDGRH